MRDSHLFKELGVTRGAVDRGARMYRHTCITRWAACMDPYTLGYLAGHSDFASTRRCVHPQAHTIMEAIERERNAQGAAQAAQARMQLEDHRGLAVETVFRAQTGATSASLMNQTGHRSAAMLRLCIRDGFLSRDNAAAKCGL